MASLVVLIFKRLGRRDGSPAMQWWELSRFDHEQSECSAGKIARRAGGSAAGLYRSCEPADSAGLLAPNRMLSVQTDRAHSVSDQRRGRARGEGASCHWPEIFAGKCRWLVPNAPERNRQLSNLREPAFWLPDPLLRCGGRPNCASRSARLNPSTGKRRFGAWWRWSAHLAECDFGRARRDALNPTAETTVQRSLP